MEEGRHPQKRTLPRGFSLMELMIVLGILAVVSAIGYPVLQRYYFNSNLRSAARDMVGDFNYQREKAMAGDATAPGPRVHRVSLNLGTNSYTLQRCMGTEIVCPGWEDLQTKNLSAFGNDIVFDPGKTKPTVFDFQPRGTVTFQNDETEGKIVLKNSRGSSATLVTNLSGRTSVDFHMQ
jgi:prepilin-type N-terminal cleavage/methylation domain-containing protein